MRKGFVHIILVIGVLLVAVVAAMFLLPRNTKAPVEKVPPSPAATQTPQPIADMTNWKTYTNESFGLNFKYPTTWSLHEIIDEEVTLPLDITLNPTSRKDRVSLVTISGELDIGDLKPFVGNEDFTKILIGKDNNIIAYRDNGEGPYRLDTSKKEYKYYIIHNKAQIVISYRVDEPDMSKVEFDQILSTFKFTK